MVSGIGTPYNPSTGEGVVGRNYAYQAGTGATMFFENQVFNPFMGSGALQMAIDDFNGDNFNHAGLGFIGGGSLTLSSTGARPIDTHPTPAGTPRWGSAWKAAVAHYYQRFAGMGVQAGVLAYRGNYLDLDPTYRDAYRAAAPAHDIRLGPERTRGVAVHGSRAPAPRERDEGG